METAMVEGIELEYELVGSGEPVLLIGPIVAEGFRPLVSERSLADRYHLIRYHKRGVAGSTHTPPPVSIADHAADAAGLLEHLGVGRAHVAGHSSGGAVALQLAVDRPEVVHTLTLLEPSLLAVPGAPAFFEKAAPAFEAFGNGDHERAIAVFLSVMSGLDRETCRGVFDARVPGGVAQATEDAETVFGVELAGLQEWAFDAESAAGITQPALSVVGAETDALFVEGADLLASWLPQLERATIDGAGHLLHIQQPEPVAQAMGAFLGRHPMTAT